MLPELILHEYETISGKLTLNDSYLVIFSGSLSERDHIFERFHRGDSTATQKIEASGLGLSLAREIARAHGGDIQLDAAILGQTGFILSLPVGDRD